MTAIPVPPVSRIEEEEEIDDEKLKKNLLREFDTPLAVSKRISRLSEKFESLPAEYVIKVFLRLRPFTESEINQGEDKKCLKISEDRHILTAMAPKNSKVFKASNRGIGESVQHFTFTKIFNEKTSQNDFYQETAHPLVKEFVNGSNGLIFTYGVTNSGKTYTLQGCPGNEGVIPQAIANIFLEVGDKMLEDVPFVPKMGAIHKLSDNDKGNYILMKKQVLAMADETRYSGCQKTILMDSTSDLSQIDSCNTTASDTSKLSVDQSDMPVKYAMFVSFVELYCELVYDLLAPIPEDKLKSGRSRPVLCISDDKKGTSHIKGMREIQVNSAREVLKILSAGQKNLHVAATKLNKDSSRSHCIFTITLVQIMDVPNPHGGRISKISFCDLAGSERLSKTGEAGDRLKEAGNINNSLMKLGMCIANLRHNQRFKNESKKQRTVSFRESKLTRLFRNYLLGEGRACMIVNANMCSSGFDETVHVLKFSAVAREVQIINKPRLSRPPKRSSTTIDDDDVIIKNKSSRMTIGWENKMPPIKDVDESTEAESDNESDDESDSESLEESVYECDVEYWKNREKKYEEIISMLRKELQRVRNEMSEKEKVIRRQCYENSRAQIVQIQQSHEEHIEDTIAILEEEQERKKKVMVDLAMNDINEVKGRYEDKVWDLTAKNTSLENELKECQAKLDEKITSVNDAENKIITLEIKVNELQMEVEKKTQEADALKKQNHRSSSGHGENMEDMITQFEEGKNLIRSLMEEIDERRQQIEDIQEDNDKLQTHLTSLQDNTKKVIDDEVAQRMDRHENEFSKVKSALESLQREISEMEDKSEHIIKTHVDTSQDIIVMDDAKGLKFTESILQHLVESSQTKGKQVDLLTTNLVEMKSEMLTSQNKLTAAYKVIGILRKMIPDIRNDLVNSKKEITQQQESFKSCIDSHISSMLGTIKSSTSENTLVLDKLRAEKEGQIAANEDLKQQVLKLTENETKLSENIAQLQKVADTVNELREKKQSVMNEKTDLESELRELMEQLSDTKKLLDETESKCRQENLNKNAESEKLKRYENELQDKIEILRDTRTELRSKEEENKELKTQLGNANKILEESQLKYNKDIKDKNADGEKLKNLEREIQKDKETMRTLRSDIRAKERENKEMKSNLEDFERKNKELQTNLSDVTKGNDIKEEKLTMLELKMDEMQKKNDSLQEEINAAQFDVKSKEAENESLTSKMQKLSDEKTAHENALEDLRIEQKKLSKARNLSESEKSELEESLERKEKEYEKLQASYNEYKSRTENHIEETKKYHKDELENAKNRLAEEVSQLKIDLAHSKTAVETKKNELASFRVNKDKLVKAIEIQVSNEKACNEKLRHELDEQMKEVVKLKSKHAAAMAENSELMKQLEMKENIPQSTPLKQKKSLSTSNIVQLQPQVKVEPFYESVSRTNSRRTRKKSDTESLIEKSCPSTRSRRGTKRTSSILKRGKCSTRPATPLPEATSDEEANELSPGKKTRTADSSVRNENIGVLDDSELLKETGNERGFPETVLEIDATPSTSSKKATRTRKRVEKKNEDSEDPDFKITRKPTRRKAKATNSNNSNSNNDNAQGSPALASVTRNISQVGALIKNSPVGNALKRIEEVISPANKSPKRSRRVVEDRSGRRGKRYVKLHPDDISSPLEASPDITEQDRFTPVPDTPARMVRKLRSRK